MLLESWKYTGNRAGPATTSRIAMTSAPQRPPIALLESISIVPCPAKLWSPKNQYSSRRRSWMKLGMRLSETAKVTYACMHSCGIFDVRVLKLTNEHRCSVRHLRYRSLLRLHHFRNPHMQVEEPLCDLRVHGEQENQAVYYDQHR